MKLLKMIWRGKTIKSGIGSGMTSSTDFSQLEKTYGKKAARKIYFEVEKNFIGKSE